MPQPYNSAEEKPHEPVESIPLSVAVLCANCEMITAAKNGHCLVCGGHSVVNLGKLMNRGHDGASLR